MDYSYGSRLSGYELGSWAMMLGFTYHKCLRVEENVQLSKCGGCRRVSYCGTECAKLDWERHKPMCKALTDLEKDKNSSLAARLVSSFPDTPTPALGETEKRKLIEQQTDVYFTSQKMARRGFVESSWVQFEPWCIVCMRTDMAMQMEANVQGKGTVPQRLTPCKHCELSFFCLAHHAAAHELHCGPCEDLHDDLSQCQMNKLIREHESFKVMAKECSLLDNNQKLRWVPARVHSSWISLDGLSWEGEFIGELWNSFNMLVPLSITPLLAAVSDIYTMPMTILCGLSKLNDDDLWTRKQTLTVHVLGANAREASCWRVFEEILHCLPKVKTLKIILCGPDVPSRSSNHRICTDCTAHNRSCLLTCAALAYHDFVETQGKRFKTPDLCIAFNSGTSVPNMGYTWEMTMKLLVEYEIPSVFTAYDCKEAMGIVAMLGATGATLHPALQLTRNPWGSMEAIPMAYSVYSFTVENSETVHLTNVKE
ncbi:MYND-type domain-containing protein [Mycena sanguinolenta]|uniref:MYND-type domain-containing protein n=1 Tax=Mycena sanguinolenta TaxID=230812 RepID=A0A8H6ZIP4_9AGAR|nr:MYND-type domain-containing protein [Mycena sanguinolenta]